MTVPIGHFVENPYLHHHPVCLLAAVFSYVGLLALFLYDAYVLSSRKPIYLKSNSQWT